MDACSHLLPPIAGELPPVPVALRVHATIRGRWVQVNASRADETGLTTQVVSDDLGRWVAYTSRGRKRTWVGNSRDALYLATVFGVRYPADA